MRNVTDEDEKYDIRKCRNKSTIAYHSRILLRQGGLFYSDLSVSLSCIVCLSISLDELCFVKETSKLI